MYVEIDMRMRKFASLFFLVFYPLLSQAQDRTAPAQIWNTTTFSQRFDWGLEALFETENRMSTDAPAWRRNSLSPQLIWHYSPRYDFSIGYENRREWMEESMADEMGGKQIDIVEQNQNMGFWTGTIKYDLNKWKFSSRQRFEFSDLEGRAMGHFRQRTAVTYTGTFLPLHLKPFVMDEWFYDLVGSGGLDENDFGMGVMYEINKAWSVEILGMRMDEWDNAGNVLTTPVVGINITARF